MRLPRGGSVRGGSVGELRPRLAQQARHDVTVARVGGRLERRVGVVVPGEVHIDGRTPLEQQVDELEVTCCRRLAEHPIDFSLQTDGTRTDAKFIVHG